MAPRIRCSGERAAASSMAARAKQAMRGSGADPPRRTARRCAADRTGQALADRSTTERDKSCAGTYRSYLRLAALGEERGQPLLFFVGGKAKGARTEIRTPLLQRHPKGGRRRELLWLRGRLRRDAGSRSAGCRYSRRSSSASSPRDFADQLDGEQAVGQVRALDPNEVGKLEAALEAAIGDAEMQEYEPWLFSFSPAFLPVTSSRFCCAVMSISSLLKPATAIVIR
jgi:hypothetical protein